MNEYPHEQAGIAMGTAEALNRDCSCDATDLARLRSRIDRITGTALPIVQSHPHLFSSTPVFLEPLHFAQMQQTIRTIDAIVQSDTYRTKVLASVPEIARKAVPQHGVFFGYDFHIQADGPKLTW